MVHNRRARPTLRLLHELDDGWQDSAPKRAVNDGRHSDLHPLSELPHPLIAKAATWLGSNPDEDGYCERIRAVERLVLWEIKTGQWRGAVWYDPDTEVHWLCAAGLAKGNHEDRDDFYETLGRMDNADVDALKPTAEDIRLLKRETFSAALTAWELDIQAQVHACLTSILNQGEQRLSIRHPVRDEHFADVTITITAYNEPDYDVDDCVIEIDFVDTAKGSALGWHLTLRVLISINPPVQGWDATDRMYSTITEPGELARQADDLAAYIESGELRAEQPGTVSHYTHGQHLASSYVNGTAVRALCGVIFVPTQDHERFEPCPACESIRALFPQK
jgi:hypothetical protein